MNIPFIRPADSKSVRHTQMTSQQWRVFSAHCQVCWPKLKSISLSLSLYWRYKHRRAPCSPWPSQTIPSRTLLSCACFHLWDSLLNSAYDIPEISGGTVYVYVLRRYLPNILTLHWYMRIYDSNKTRCFMITLIIMSFMILAR